MSTLHLYWTIGSGDSATGGNLPNATLDDTRKIVQKVLDSSGSAELSVKDGPEIGPQSLQLLHEAGRSVMMLGEDDGTEYAVRSYHQPTDSDDESKEPKESKEEILGNLWESSSICSEPTIVHTVFQEFIATGNVSTDLLNY